MFGPRAGMLGGKMRFVKLVFVAPVLVLAGCQTNATYTQYMPGPPLEYAQAKCNMLAPATNQGYFAFGSAAYVTGVAIGNAIDNAIREQQFIKNCMAMQGWRQDPPGTKKASTPLPSAQAPRPGHKSARRAPTAYELGIPSRVVAGQ